MNMNGILSSEKAKKLGGILFSALLFALAVVFAFCLVREEPQNAYLLSVDGCEIGCVASRDDTDAFYQQILRALPTGDPETENPGLSSTYLPGLPENHARTLSYEPCVVRDRTRILSEAALREKLYSLLTEGMTQGFVIYADEVPIAHTALTDSEISEVLLQSEKILSDRMKADGWDAGCSLCRDSVVLWGREWVEEDSLCDRDALLSLFCDGNVLRRSVAQVKTEAVLLAYDTEYRENDENYDGVQTYISAGKNGLAQVTTLYHYDFRTGDVLSAEETERTVVREPVNAAAYYGDYPLRDDSVCTEHFIFPIDEPTADNLQYTNEQIGWNSDIPRVYLSSLYGGRDLWGAYDFHLGYDIVAPYNADVHACDGGVVVYAAYSSSYGYYVRVLHKNHVETLYAHLSERLVRVGDVVRQGDVIGRVGATGNVSGTHLHLEFREDHVTCDPAKYLTLPEWLIYIDV